MGVWTIALIKTWQDRPVNDLDFNRNPWQAGAPGTDSRKGSKMSDEIDAVLATAIALTREASAIPMSYFRKPLDLVAKADASPVTIADRATEAFLRDRLAAAFPQDGLLGEEFGVTEGSGDALWVIDPIDGTRSFITGQPLFGMLLGRVQAGVPQIGVVRMPALDETFAGACGRGATLNGGPIRARTTTDLASAMVYVNEAEKIEAADPARLGRLCRVGHTRRMGYDCYPHALVAAGQIDVVVDCGLQPYDYLPLIALVEAAGGIICDWQGNGLTGRSDGRVITAATPQLRDAMIDLLQG
jgi:histidinol phosphatase-like enzyme (inositol monophosphatase family)